MSLNSFVTALTVAALVAGPLWRPVSLAAQQQAMPVPAMVAADTVPVPPPSQAAPAPRPPAEEKLDPNATPTEALGDLLNARGRYLAAMHVLEQLQPRTAVAANKIGVASEHMLMFDKAKLSFEESLRLDPKYGDAWNNLATVYHSRGDLGRAEKLYRKAIHFKPQSADSWQNLGTLYYNKRKFKKGDEAYKEAIRIDPRILERTVSHGIQTTGSKQNSAEMHYHLARTFAQAGSRNLALDYLRKSIIEGFHDRDRMMHEKEFADLRTMPVFLQMADDLKKN